MRGRRNVELLTICGGLKHALMDITFSIGKIKLCQRVTESVHSRRARVDLQLPFRQTTSNNREDTEEEGECLGDGISAHCGSSSSLLCGFRLWPNGVREFWGGGGETV